MKDSVYQFLAIIFAAFGLYLVWPLLIDTINCKAPFWIKVFLLGMWSIPAWGTYLFAPIIAKAFVSTTNKAEDEAIKFYRKNK